MRLQKFVFPTLYCEATGKVEAMIIHQPYLYNYLISVFRREGVELGGQVQLELFALVVVDAELGLDEIVPILARAICFGVVWAELIHCP